VKPNQQNVKVQNNDEVRKDPPNREIKIGHAAILYFFYLLNSNEEDRSSKANDEERDMR
jgi:hypothetical protein